MDNRSRAPVGALLLIALGVLFLLGNMGWLHFYWLHRSWPVALIALGIWLLISRHRATGNPRRQPVP
jgi:hypothetical protein